MYNNNKYNIKGYVLLFFFYLMYILYNTFTKSASVFLNFF
nr:MAG TPA: hypothetical protein [Caudoviricetes sp.]